MRNKKLTRVMALAALTTLATTTMMSGTLAKYTSTLSASTDGTGDNPDDQTNAVPIAKWAFNINGTEVDLLRDDGFYAKYTTETSGDEVISFGLFDTIYEYDAFKYDEQVLNDSSTTNTKIAPGTWGGFTLNDAGNGMGEVAFTIENKSDVDATFKLTLSMSADTWGYDTNTWGYLDDDDKWVSITTLPIEFSIDGGTIWNDFVMTYDDTVEGSEVFTMTLEGILQFDGSTATYDAAALETLFDEEYSNIIVGSATCSFDDENFTSAGGANTTGSADIGLMWRWKFEQDAITDGTSEEIAAAADLIDTIIGIAAAEMAYEEAYEEDETEVDATYGTTILPMTAELVFTQID